MCAEALFALKLSLRTQLMHPFPLDTIIFMVEPGVSELGLEGAVLRLASTVVGVFDQWGYPGWLKS